MIQNKVICPACDFELSISDALGAELKSFYEIESNKRVSDAIKKVRAEIEYSNDLKIKELTDQLAGLRSREEMLNEKENVLKQEALHLEEVQFSTELEIMNRVESERLKIEQEAALKLQNERQKALEIIRAEVEQNKNLEINELSTQVAELREREQEFKRNELILRRKSQEMEEKQANVELEIQRKLDDERGRIAYDTAQRINEENRLKSLEKDKQLSDMHRQIEELKKRAEQGSQKSQGDVLEIEIERALKEAFPFDYIEVVPNGTRGGDIIHHVMTRSGKSVGKILWEMKNTKTFSESWINKLKDDQRAISANSTILVTSALPKGVTGLTCYDGVWVTDFNASLGIATALRTAMIEIDLASAMSSNMDEKVESLYVYLTGIQFKQRVEAIVSSFESMHIELQKEKVAINKIWAAREQQINRMLLGTTGMYGDIQGIIGADLPKILALELNSCNEDN